MTHILWTPNHQGRRPIMDAYLRLLDHINWDKIMRFEVDALVECIYIRTTEIGSFIRIKHVMGEKSSHFEIADYDNTMIPIIIPDDDWNLLKVVDDINALVSYVSPMI